MWQESSPCQRQAGPGSFWLRQGCISCGKALPTPTGHPTPEATPVGLPTQHPGPRLTPVGSNGSPSTLGTGSPEIREEPGCPGLGSPQMSSQLCDNRPQGRTSCLSPGRTFQRPPEWLLANRRTGNRAGPFRGPWGGEGTGLPRPELQACPETRTLTVSP